MQNYDSLIEKVAESSGLEKEEINKRVEAKRAKLSGLISKEGAAQIIAAELGISFENQEFKISELMPGMKKANVIGKIINLFPIRSFEKNGQENKVANMIIADETGSMRAVLWDTNHISHLENESIKQGDVVEIHNASMRDGELHLGSFSEFKKSDKVIENVKTEQEAMEKTIEEIQQGQRVKIRAVAVQMYTPKFYFTCPECRKKVIQEGEGYKCQEHGTVQPKERAILNLMLDDGTETLRAVLFSDQINNLIPELYLKDNEKFENFKKDLLGTELYVSGIIRKNSFFNNLELIVSDIQKVNVEELIKELEAK